MSQAEVADAAGISRSLVSRLEAGNLESTSLGLIRRVAGVLGVSVTVDPRWRGAELAQLLDQRHARMVRRVVERLTALGWECLPEHTFSEWGERGAIDVFAWHQRGRAVLCVEVKTRLVDLQNLLSAADRKRRLAPVLARKLGWVPVAVGSVLVLPEENWARNAIERHRPVIDAKFAARTLTVRYWLVSPNGDLGGVWFLANVTPGDAKRRSGALMRVRHRPGQAGSSTPRSGPTSVNPKVPAAERRSGPLHG
jgi:transcriptional regulator with XRE-family HTH domain